MALSQTPPWYVAKYHANPISKVNRLSLQRFSRFDELLQGDFHSGQWQGLHYRLLASFTDDWTTRPYRCNEGECSDSGGETQLDLRDSISISRLAPNNTDDQMAQRDCALHLPL